MTGGYFYWERASWSEDWRDITIDGHSVRVKIADTPEERERGLQDVESLGRDEGMLFIFEKPTLASFWNKNLKIDLDILWIKDLQVQDITGLPREEGPGVLIVDAPSEMDMALEVPAGFAKNLEIAPGALILGL